MRQVTHALLTRPPLSQRKLHTEVFRFQCFVRLACVKHAASVHPEPGSNSQIIRFASRSSLTLWLIFNRSTVCLVFVLNFLKSKVSFLTLLFWNFQGFKHCSIFCFQGSLLLASSAATRLSYHTLQGLSTTFFNFFPFPL